MFSSYTQSLFGSSNNNNNPEEQTAQQARVLATSPETDLDNLAVEELVNLIEFYDSSKGYGRKLASMMPTTLGMKTPEAEFIYQLRDFMNEKWPDEANRTGSFSHMDTIELIKFLDAWTKDMVPGSMSQKVHFNLLNSANRTSTGRGYRLATPRLLHNHVIDPNYSNDGFEPDIEQTPEQIIHAGTTATPPALTVDTAAEHKEEEALHTPGKLTRI